MDNKNECEYVILDVRTEEEFAAGHIPGAILLPDNEISAKAESMLGNKDQLILQITDKAYLKHEIGFVFCKETAKT